MGQLIALLLIAQLVEHWCSSLAGPGSNPYMSHSELAIATVPPTTFVCTTWSSFFWLGDKCQGCQSTPLCYSLYLHPMGVQGGVIIFDAERSFFVCETVHLPCPGVTPFPV